MARRKTNNRKKTAHAILNAKNISLLFVLLLAVSYIFLLSRQTGVLGIWIRSFYYFLFGISAYIIPLYLIGLIVLVRTGHFRGRVRFLFLWTGGLLLLFFACLSIYYSLTWNFGTHLAYTRALSEQGRGSGVIAAALGWLLRRLLGTVGSTVILILYLATGLMLALSLSAREVWQVVGHGLQIAWHKSRRFIQEKRARYNETKKEKELQISEEPAAETETASEPVSQKSFVFQDYKSQAETEKESEKPGQINIGELHTGHKVISTYELPPISILEAAPAGSVAEKSDIARSADRIENTLTNFGIDAKVTQVNRGPTVTCFELEPAPGVKVSRIVNLSDDLALNLRASDIRIVAPLPGKAAVGLEVPNDTKDIVKIREIIDSKEFTATSAGLPFALGKTISGKPIVSAIEKMPHLLIAGATGSGKSVCINTIIMSIVYHARPDEVKLVLIDPKVVELSVYNGIPHLIVPVVTQPKKAAAAMQWAVDEMEKRYELFSKFQVRDITSYREKARQDAMGEMEPLPYIVIVIDELADLMMVADHEVENYIARLAQMARACGIHLIVATQRPSVDVTTGTIKANIPSRISFQVSSQIDSRTILDTGGAEKLLGKGDMLFYPSGFSKPLRVQGAYITEKEVENVVNWLRESHHEQYDAEVVETIEENVQPAENPEDGDPLLTEALDIIIEEGQASVSLLQRKMRVGYARAGRMIDELEERGYIGKHEGSKPRKVLVSYNPMKEAYHEPGQ
jgi:S-DNA-T family DNA segregation ATPase FtsK/SpoIIIE